MLLVSLLLNVALKAVVRYADSWVPLPGLVLSSAELALASADPPMVLGAFAGFRGEIGNVGPLTPDTYS